MKTERDHSRAKSLLPFTLAFVLLFGPSAWAADRVCIIISGLGGLPEYEENFTRWADGIAEACGQEAGSVVHEVNGRKQKRPEILEIFNQVASSPPARDLWIFLIGHANHDGHDYKFNIAGPDLTDDQLKVFLDSVGDIRTFVVAGTSASGDLAADFSRTNRVIVTATRTPRERQPPLFMSFFLEAVTSAEADSDKNGKVSLLEGFLYSRQKVTEWFEEKGRIQTEHPLLDDNGAVRLNERKSDESEVSPDQFGSFLAAQAYLSSPPEQAYRSLEAKELAAERVVIEREIEDLKFHKKQFSDEAYYTQLEILLVKLAETSKRIRELEEQQ